MRTLQAGGNQEKDEKKREHNKPDKDTLFSLGRLIVFCECHAASCRILFVTSSPITAATGSHWLLLWGKEHAKNEKHACLRG